MSSNPDSTVAIRQIKVAQISDGQALIDSGLKANEQVVVDGQYKLQPGTHVTMLHGKAAEEAAAQDAPTSANPMNISAPFIERPIADGSADGRVAGAVWSPIRYCPWRRFRTSTIRRSRLRHSCQAPTRTTMASTVASPLRAAVR